jgi:predicted nucleic acid-binding protein
VDFVLDASVALAWYLRAQSTPTTLAAREALARDTAWVPHHFAIEVARTLRRHERRKLISPEFVDEALGQFRNLPITQDMVGALDVMSSVVSFARRHTLRVADAAYLELAQRLGLPLATRDAALTRAAKAAGVELFGVS